MAFDTRKFLTGPLFAPAVLGVALLLSLLFFALFRPEKEGRVFFYPHNGGTNIGSERRGIPKRDEMDEKIEVFLEELFLGPETLALTYAMPRGTKIRNIAVIGKTVYVDLNLRALDTIGEIPVSLDDALANLRYNILYNFNRMEEVVFTIGGSQVGAPYYRGEDSRD